MIVLFSTRTLDHIAAAWAARQCAGPGAELVCTSPRPQLLLDLVRGRPVFSACSELSRRELIQVNDSSGSLAALEVEPGLCRELEGYFPSGGELKLAPGKPAAAAVWYHFKGDEPMPWLLSYSDPNCELPNATPIQAALMSFGTDWERWDEVWPLPASELLRVGDAVLRTLVEIQAEAGSMAFDQSFLGHVVPMMNFLPTQGTQMLKTLARGRPFAVCWVQSGPETFQYELVSEGAVDVGALARKFKGRGDAHRAFIVTTRQIHN